MKYLIIFLIFFVQAAHGREWYEGMWTYDASVTERNTPGISAQDMREVRAGFDKWAGNITVTPKRVKGKKAKLGVPYRVVGNGRNTVLVEVKGPAIEFVKAFNPDLRKQSLRCKLIRINHNLVAFEVPELQTIRMYLRRVQ
ncbi:MAG: hypothetical protein P1U89_15230 [Verrucomicrobiales bacterium]|nr:hypothetical protein [Verrucomicrobiales bacterium]